MRGMSSLASRAYALLQRSSSPGCRIASQLRLSLLVLFILIFTASPVLALDGDIHIGNKVLNEKFRHKREGYFLPVGETVAQFGMSIEQTEGLLLIRGSRHGDLRVPLDKSEVEINGECIDFGILPIARDGGLFYPEKFFEKVLGLTVEGKGGDEGIFVARNIEIGDVLPEGVSIRFPYPLSRSDFELDDGDSIRLVLDFDGAVLGKGMSELTGVGEGFMNFRAAQFTRKPDVVRVVLELDKPEGEKPEYRIDGKPWGLWIGLRDDEFSIDLENTEDGCTSIIKGTKYDDLKTVLLEDEGQFKLVLDFEGAKFAEGYDSLQGVGPVSRVRIADHDGTVRVVFDLLGDPAYEVEELAGDRLKVTFSGKRTDLSGRVIVIDPGHGGTDPGAIKGDIEEKSLNLEMASILANELRSYGATVYMTRDRDRAVELSDRMAIAKKYKPDLLICIHTNATRAPETEIHGPMLIYDKACDYRGLLNIVYREMVSTTGREGIGPRPDDRGLYMLRKRGEINVLFIETAFLTNPGDLVLLTQPEGGFKRGLMHSTAVGIVRYFTGGFNPATSAAELVTRGFDNGIFGLIDEEGLID